MSDLERLKQYHHVVKKVEKLEEKLEDLTSELTDLQSITIHPFAPDDRSHDVLARAVYHFDRWFIVCLAMIAVGVYNGVAPVYFPQYWLTEPFYFMWVSGVLGSVLAMIFVKVPLRYYQSENPRSRYTYSVISRALSYGWLALLLWVLTWVGPFILGVLPTEWNLEWSDYATYVDIAMIQAIGQGIIVIVGHVLSSIFVLGWVIRRAKHGPAMRAIYREVVATRDQQIHQLQTKIATTEAALHGPRQSLEHDAPVVPKYRSSYYIEKMIHHLSTDPTMNLIVALNMAIFEEQVFTGREIYRQRLKHYQLQFEDIQSEHQALVNRHEISQKVFQEMTDENRTRALAHLYETNDRLERWKARG